MAAETDSYIIATYALWAGDFEYAEKLLRDFSHHTPRIDHGAEAPEDFIRVTGALRLRQLRKKRDEFKHLAAEHGGRGVITDEPMILETAHLRATLWRLGEREFVLQGFLTDLKWQEELFARSHREEKHRREPRGKYAPHGDEKAGLLVEKVPYTPFGAAWVVDGNPFIQVEITDLGLLEANGLWTERRMPETAAAIKDPFLGILKALDEQRSDTGG